MASTEILKYCIECDTKYEFGSKFCLVCETKINENIRTIEEEGMQKVTGFSNYLEVNSKKKTFQCHQPKLLQVNYSKE